MEHWPGFDSNRTQSLTAVLSFFIPTPNPMKSQPNLHPISALWATKSRLNLAHYCRVILILALSALLVPALLAGTVKHGISAGQFIITQTAGLDNDFNCTNTLGLSINDFRLGTTQRRGDYDVQIGASAADDIPGGILISSVTENGRANYSSNSFCISTIHDGSGNPPGGTPPYRICSFGTFTGQQEYNINVAGAWFPYNKYIGGLARNTVRANAGSNDLLIASSQLVWGTHYLHIAVTNDLSATAGSWALNDGRSVLDLTSLGINSQTDGILLVNHGKDEANFALSKPQTDGTWLMYVHDNNAASAGNYEQDPIAFVYIPRTNTDVISGRFSSDSGGQPSIDIYSGSSPQFTVSAQGAGKWLLKMNNYYATNGILIISAEGGGSYDLDNIVSYQMLTNGAGWVIQSRDSPGNGLQTPFDIVNGESVPGRVASFVFIPAPTPGITVSPTNNILTSEWGTNALFTVVLDSKPSANVTINVSSSDTTEATTDVSSLTFTPANWNQPQTVNVVAVDDLDNDGQVPYTIILSAATSTDPIYNGMDPADVAGINADNEAGITVSKNGLVTTEAATTDSFTIVLNSAPTDNVTIGLSSSDTTEGTVSPSTVTFTTSDWSTPQTVTATGVNDDVADGNVAYTIITAPATSTDTAYNGFNALDVAAVNLDNDTAGVVFSPASGLVVDESGTTTNFTVVLTSEPTANVTVNLVSADSSEGTVTPASRTFTPVNWATPQSFTLTGVNDSVNDGNVTYNLNGTTTSSDTTYAAMTPTIQATTMDNEAALTLPSGPLQYAIGLPGVGIDPAATVVDADTTDYDTGSLTVTLTVNAASNDRLGIRNTGNGFGEIGVSGSTVSYSGTPIGTFSGGVGATPLVVSFNSSANPESAQALVRSITFNNVTNTPSVAARTVAFALADGDGGTSSASKQILLGLLHSSDFQNGTDGGFGVYTNGADTELNVNLPFTAQPQGSSPLGIRLETIPISSTNPVSIALLRFDNIVGNNPGQIPAGAKIVSADLVLNITDSGDGSPMYRMLIPWNADTETWDSIGNGVSFDNVEATNVWFSQINVTNLSQATGLGHIKVGVIPDVQAWVDGQPNFGWALPGWFMNDSAARDNTFFTPTEGTTITNRPRLIVKWVPAGTATASFRFGVNGYTGTHDTRIRQIVPDTTAGATVNLFVDGEVTANSDDPEQVFIRFDNFVGTTPGQVPPGAIIHAAALDLASTIGNAPGDGGRIHRMLQSWSESSTWNTLVDGVVADNVEAVTTPTATAGDVNLSETVQGAFHTFLVTPDVQLWVNGTANYGWAMLPWPFGGDGWGLTSSEAPIERERPQLRVYYTSYAAFMKTPGVSPGSVQVNFSGAANEQYLILRAPSVTGPWTTNGTATTGVDGNGTYTDNAPLSGNAFYRAFHP